MKKKIAIFAIFTALLISFCACSGKENTIEPGFIPTATPTTGAQNTATPTVKPTSTPRPTNTPTNTPTPIPTIEVPTINFTKQTIPDNEAMRFLADMKIGWNLGNTLEATITGNDPSNHMYAETAWNNIKTTKELIDLVKGEGFNTIRVPVSWHNHVFVNDEGNYEIYKEWLDRVQEVVDYVIDDDMYCVLNIHHDDAKEFVYPDSEHLENSQKYVHDVWLQIANRFKDYDNKLIMESLNEPRLVGTQFEWYINTSNSDVKDAIECLNKINQTFVDTVRATGGNNATRYLSVPGYDASAQGALLKSFKIPEDTEGNVNKIIVSVHAYTPYSFALQSPKDSGSKSNFVINQKTSTSEIDNFMKQLYDTYISKGIPVYIGEFGARDKDNYKPRVNFTAYYVALARSYGLTCCWWDNNAFNSSGECFGLFERRTKKIIFPDIIKAMMTYCE
ncbi:MAG: glycoside hydrolase family 5 protein [Lachnospiraceae bacterium]|nr:glycoside hydrolase family 5 protein [Lachnospiraceae bacterium]